MLGNGTQCPPPFLGLGRSSLTTLILLQSTSTYNVNALQTDRNWLEFQYLCAPISPLLRFGSVGNAILLS